MLPEFINAAPVYQHAILKGFKRLFDTPKAQQPPIDWDQTWPALMDFFEKLLENPDLGKKAEGRAPFNWLPPAMADLLHAGTRDDDRAYSPSLLSRGWAILETLAERVVPGQAADERDPMTAAINTGKGRTLEAIFSHALREARLADKDSGNHDAVWQRLQPRFDLELEKCKSGNYEFSTLVGAYLANLEYLNTDWLRASIPRIFPSEQPTNLSAALSGLAYSAATRRSYVMLRDAGVVDSALRIEAKGRDTRKMVVERIVLAYLWDETLDSPRISYLFRNGLLMTFKLPRGSSGPLAATNLRPNSEQRSSHFGTAALHGLRARQPLLTSF